MIPYDQYEVTGMFQVGQKIRWKTSEELAQPGRNAHTSAVLLSQFQHAFPDPLTVMSVHGEMIGLDDSHTMFHEDWFKPVSGFSLNSI